MESRRGVLDAILIPGGGVRADYEVPLWTKRRLDRAIELGGCEYFITLSAGSVHKPMPLDRKGQPMYESVAAAKYLIGKGIDAKGILCETSSYDTIGNAYFSKVIHVDPLSLSKLLVITSEFHMERTKAVFQWLYSPKFSGKTYDLAFEAVSDSLIDDALLKGRVIREKECLRTFKENTRGIDTMIQLHKWLFFRHNAYSVSGQPEKLEGEVLETY